VGRDYRRVHPDDGGLGLCLAGGGASYGKKEEEEITILFIVLRALCSALVMGLGYYRRFVEWPRSAASEIGGEIMMAIGLMFLLMR